ncbi:hypothetical protein GCM10010168_86320 [Actinoplanes ianthinogenes]|uniref:Uncharacterized protein n=1 Tax=Actinoplanes ianthinogenes TaxID=122358 RepID=A0ABN6CK49_9ACTN|nr:hypothetical protein [Actinoplanes ianthinogenes]BCJ45363.1 hypothetical protein Aiant_60200 [Actinoplanes ianthinogenes]GGR54027.1 hypothetical protein GCM10010168_86320 [Actinoplanes ianthinogenes]
MTAPCAWLLLMSQMEALDGVPSIVLPQACAELVAERVRFDRPDLGVWFIAVGEVCEGHAESAARLGALRLGEIPRHVPAGT